MIVTCASCLTKFSLDESKLPARGAKVRCSRCQHVFHLVPPLKTKEEEVVEDFESFAKSHGDIMEPGSKTMKPSPTKPREREEMPPVREERVFPDEEKLPDGLAYRFEGLENEGHTDCSPADIRAVYRERFSAHAVAVRTSALAAGCDYRRLSTAIPYLQTLAGFLVERSG